jgi:hypothetical protein
MDIKRHHQSRRLTLCSSPRGAERTKQSIAPRQMVECRLSTLPELMVF